MVPILPPGPPRRIHPFHDSRNVDICSIMKHVYSASYVGRESFRHLLLVSVLRRQHADSKNQPKYMNTTLHTDGVCKPHTQHEAVERFGGCDLYVTIISETLTGSRPCASIGKKSMTLTDLDYFRWPLRQFRVIFHCIRLFRVNTNTIWDISVVQGF